MDSLRTMAQGRTGSVKRPVNHIRFEDDNDIDDIFEFGATLGQGSFGVVIEAMNKAKKTKYAVKAINKEKVWRHQRREATYAYYICRFTTFLRERE